MHGFYHSQNSHAISELGLLITKCIAKKEDDFQTLATLASLPTVLYKPYEKKEGDDSLVLLSSVSNIFRAELCYMKHEL